MPQNAELSEQQKKCLRLVHDGLTSKQIAPLLETTPGTVDNYINTAFAKMGLTSRREAARQLALQEKGMVQQLHLQSPAIAPVLFPDEQPEQIGDQRGFFGKLVDLPPIGGTGNDLTTSRRIIAISRVGFFAALLLIATVVTVQGIIALII